MIDHMGFDVSDYEWSKAFYEKALAPLGLKLLMEPAPGVGGFGNGQKPFFWISTRGTPQTGIHVAFEAESRDVVDAFHSARCTTRPTTAPTCWIRTATTPRRCATGRGDRLDRLRRTQETAVCVLLQGS